MRSIALNLVVLIAMAVPVAVRAGRPYLVSNRTPGEIWRIEDTNGDGDALDIGERTLWADGFTRLAELATLDQAVYVVEDGVGAPGNRVVRLEDLNQDGDALDIGERSVWADGLTLPWGIAHDDQGNWFVSDLLNANVLKLADLNSDGDALDIGEKTLYAQDISLSTSVLFDDGALYVASLGTDVIHRLADPNGDSDALDFGENLVVTPAVADAPIGLLADGSGGFFASSAEPATVYRAQDFNGDGDFLDLAEMLSYADDVFGGLSAPRAMSDYSGGGFLLADSSGKVFHVLDQTGDGDALDLGEVRLFADGMSMPFGIVALPGGLPGDYNNNGTIDAADYSAWRDALTAGATSLTNDPTPGTVDESDFLYWRDHFGEMLGSGAGAAQAAVPEPSTLALFLLGSIAGAVCWRGNFLVICGSTGYNPIRSPC